MKKITLVIAIASLFSLSLSSCSSTDNAESTETSEQAVETSYYCPMKCEGGKTYPEAGSCPVCGMDLVEVE